jgi:hypothetical protein
VQLTIERLHCLALKPMHIDLILVPFSTDPAESQGDGPVVLDVG